MLAKRINYLKNFLVQKKQKNKKHCKRKFILIKQKMINSQEQTKLRIKEDIKEKEKEIKTKKFRHPFKETK